MAAKKKVKKKSTGMKDTNPKDAAAAKRLPLDLIPPRAMFWLSLGLYEGRWKYGRRNWITGGVRKSVYIGAAMRHLMKFAMGETYDPKSGVHHLGNAMACAAIMLDADENGVLIDDMKATERDGRFAVILTDEAEAVMSKIQEAFPQFVEPPPRKR